MASFQTAGYRSTITPEGRKIVQIPVSVTDDTSATVPTAPTGMRLVSNEYTIRPDGGRDYVYTYESSGSSPGDAQIQINGQAAQEPIETHPAFNGVASGSAPAGTVSDADLAAIKAALTSGQAPQLTGTGPDLQAAQDLYNLMIKGVTHYFTPSGITYSETFDELLKPNLNELCSVNRPPPDAPLLRQGSNWLLIGLRAQKLYQPDTQSSFWRVTREWLASGPRGWNADFKIYE
jgi:hypothetical protein